MRPAFQGWVQRAPVATFLICTFAWTWLWWTPLASSLYGVPVADMNIPLTLAVVLVGAFGPTISAILLTWVESGRAGVAALLSRLVRFRIKWYWYAALAVPPLLWVLTLLAAGALLPMSVSLGTQWYLFPLALLSSLIGGPIAEEIGWRGYLVPRMQRRFSALSTGVIIGAIWAVWHVPMFFVQGVALAIAETGQPLAMLRYFLTGLAVGVLFVWVYNNTRGSIGIAMLLHASFNASGGFAVAAQASTLAPTDIQQLTWLYVAVVWVVTALMVAFWGPANLARHPRLQTEPMPPPQALDSMRAAPMGQA